MKSFLLAGSLLLGLHCSAFSFQDQLEAMNSQWGANRSLLVETGARTFTNDRAFVQAHFAAVEVILRNADVSALNAEQLAARNRNIQVLHEYAARGIFPHNTCGYSTPVFIDEFGTHCAVGHLMQQSGQEALAVRISSRNNLVRAADIDDPEIYAWQEASGFTLQELALIQPAYAAPATAFEQQYACTTAYFEGYANYNYQWSKGVTVGEQTPETVKQVWYSGECNNGVLNGKWEQYHAPGVIWIQGNFRNGQKDGEWKYFSQNYNRDGVLQKLETWANGKLHGHFVSYDYAGKKASEGNYVNGLKTGTWLQWQQGALSMKEHYTEGKLDGEKFQYWSEQDSTKRQTCIHDVYKNGVLQTRVHCSSPGILAEKLWHIADNRYRSECYVGAGILHRTGQVQLTMRRDSFENMMYPNLPKTYHDYEVFTKIGRWTFFPNYNQHLLMTQPYGATKQDSAHLYFKDNTDSVSAIVRYWKKGNVACFDTTSYVRAQPYQVEPYNPMRDHLSSESWTYVADTLVTHIAMYYNGAERFRYEYQHGKLVSGHRKNLDGSYIETWAISTFTGQPVLWYQQFDSNRKLLMKGPVADSTTRTGTWEFYNEYGAVIAKGEYVNGVKEGKWMEINPDGTTWEGEYKKGKKKGSWSGKTKEGDVRHEKF